MKSTTDEVAKVEVKTDASKTKKISGLKAYVVSARTWRSGGQLGANDLYRACGHILSRLMFS